MKKIYIFCCIFIIMGSIAAAQDLSSDVAAVIRTHVETHIRSVNDVKALLLANVSVKLNEDNPAMETMLSLRDSGMAKMFVFDDKDIMHKEVSYENRIFSSKILNQNFVGLLKADADKIYLSPLFLYKNKAYYMLGVKDDKCRIMMLFVVPDVESKRYAVFCGDGSLLINRMGLTKAKVSEWTKIITEANSDKFAALDKKSFTVFRPGRKYYIIYEE